jgi:acetylornithine deacetylase/succinyl-diaminopimelate desuccinylase-like protein
VLDELEPGSVVTPSMSTGFTDSHFLVARGCKVCGFVPFKDVPGETSLASLIHGHDERISVDNLLFAGRAVWEVVRRMCVV